MRHGLLHLTLDVPTDDQLLDWANTVHKPLAGHVTFFEDDRHTALETVSFAAGQRRVMPVKIMLPLSFLCGSLAQSSSVSAMDPAR